MGQKLPRLEGDTLYISPADNAKLSEAIVLTLGPPDHAIGEALRGIGLDEKDIYSMHYRVITMIVVHDAG